MIKVSNKKLRVRLKKVINVLYPEYKHVFVNKDLSVVLSKKKCWLLRLFSKTTRINYGILTSYYLPLKLTMLKYNNKDLFSTVIEDITSVKMKGEDLITYFYTEIIKVKYPHVFKEFSITDIENLRSECDYEDEEINIILMRTKERVNKAVKQTFLMRLQNHPLYYEYVVVMAVIVIVGLLYLLKVI